MTVSLSDSSSIVFVGCTGADPLADVGEQAGYAIALGLGAIGQLEESFFSVSLWVTHDDAELGAAKELWHRLQELSNDSLIPEYPDTPAIVDGVVVILAVTSKNAQYLTVGELVAAIGRVSNLTVVRVEKMSVGDVRGVRGVAARGVAQGLGAAVAADTPAINPVAGIEGALTKVGYGVVAVVVLALLAFGLFVYRKR